jgi:primosomal protein N' (replication factor Y)
VPDRESDGKRLKPILARLDNTPIVSPQLLALTRWVAERYLAPLGQCVRLAFPSQVEKQHRAPGPQRQSPPSAPLPPLTRRVLTPALAAGREELLSAIRDRRQGLVWLPGSSRDLIELYTEAAQATLRTERSALILVPETHQVEPIRRALADGGKVLTEAYHGQLSMSARRNAWERIQRGEARVVIGTRSAVFAPVVDLGLLVIDQEDHGAYKAENTPRYDARVVATQRARDLGAVLLQASAHPSLESVHATPSSKRVWLRSTTGSLPSVRTINMRGTPGEILSAPMVEAITQRLAARHRALLFLNRKGYASVLFCRDCGEAVRCTGCGLGWTFYKKELLLRCSHCGQQATAPTICPACEGPRLQPSGLGTEAAEESLRRRFPQARLLRVERARARGKTKDAELLAHLHANDYDILIATQLILTVVPRPEVSFIGILAPDAALHQPDFLAAERAYHTLREVMTLAPDDALTAEVMIQTYMPDHHVIRALAAHDPSMFYDSELAARAALGYPPSGALIGLRVTGIRDETVATAAEHWATVLRLEIKKAAGEKRPSSIQLLGPIPALPPRLRGRFRRQLIVKGEDGPRMREAVRTSLVTMEAAGHAGKLRYDVDVDPTSLIG